MKIKLFSKCFNCKKRKLFIATRTIKVNKLVAHSRAYLCNHCITELRKKVT